MKALIILREKDCGWLREIYSAHPSMFPVCNKPLLEYFIDFAILNGCSDVRVVFDEPGAEIERYFNTGSRWGICMSYGSFKKSDTIDHIIEKNSRFSQNSSLLILDGFFFIHYDKRINYGNWHTSSKSSLSVTCQSGSILFAGNKNCLRNISSAPPQVEFALSPLESLDDIYQIAMQVLAAEQHHYVLPGYGVEKGIILGRNVEIDRDVTVNEPVIVGDNVRLSSGAVIGPLAVIGSNVIIDKGTHVQESVVVEESYLGSDLTLKRKVVNANRIFSFREEHSMVSEDPFLFSSVKTHIPLPTLRRLVNSLAALLLAILMCIPFLFITSWMKLRGNVTFRRVTYFTNNQRETFHVSEVVNEGKSLAEKAFVSLSLHRFTLMFQAIQGKILLIGNRLLEVSKKNRKQLGDFEEYYPGVFGYSEADDFPEEILEVEVSERYYTVHRNILQDGRMLLKILYSSLVTSR